MSDVLYLLLGGLPPLSDLTCPSPLTAPAHVEAAEPEQDGSDAPLEPAVPPHRSGS